MSKRTPTISALSAAKEWFNLENYRNQDKLTVHDWHVELDERDRFYSTPFTLVSVGAPKNKFVFGSWSNEPDNKPNDVLRESFRLRAKRYHDVSDWFAKELVFSGLITDKEGYKHLYDWQYGRVARKQPKDPIRRIPIETEIPRNAEAYYIDFTQPETTLIEALKRIAREKRKDTPLLTDGRGHIRRIDEIMTKKWSHCQLLAYLDLSQWAALTGKKLRDTEYADLLDLREKNMIDLNPRRVTICKDNAKEVGKNWFALKWQILTTDLR